MVVKFTVKKPKAFDSKAALAVLREVMDKEVKPTLKADFEQTVRGWEHKVTFHVRSNTSQSRPLFVKMWTDDEIWQIVDLGSPPHQIWAGAYTGKSTKKALAFPSDFVPKTIPGSLVSGRGGSHGGPILRKVVNHPGTKARNFTKMIYEKRLRWFNVVMTSAMWKVAQASGHARR